MVLKRILTSYVQWEHFKTQYANIITGFMEVMPTDMRPIYRPITLNSIHIKPQQSQRLIQDFPGGTNPKAGAPTYYLAKNLPKNCMKMKKMGQRGGASLKFY